MWQRKMAYGIWLLVAFALVLSVLLLCNTREPIAKTYAEIEAIYKQKDRTESVVAKMSPELRADVERDPRRALICAVLAQAISGWPHISEQVKDEVLAQADKNIAYAVELLKVRLADASAEAIEAAGYKNVKNRHGWYNNNPATAMLFVEYPIANSLGKTSLFMQQEIEGYRQTDGNWYQPQLTFEEYLKWYSGQQWPEKLASK